MAIDYQLIECATPAHWREWLDAHHTTTDGIWLRFYKKDSGVVSVVYAEALDEALCYGWIDGQVKKYDDVSYLQKFTPRRARSMWSKRNIEHIARLTEAGLMMPSGLREVERAKADGRWQAAYDTPKNMVIPEDFLLALNANSQARTGFETLNKTQLFRIGFALQTAKRPETRAKRIMALVALLASGQKP